MPFAKRIVPFLLLALLSACNLAPPSLAGLKPAAKAVSSVTPKCGCDATGAATPRGGLAPAGPAAPPALARTPGTETPVGAAAAPGLEDYRDKWATYSDPTYGFSFEYPAVYDSKDFGMCAARTGANPPPGSMPVVSLGSRTTLTLFQTGETLQAAAAAFQADPARKDFQFDAPKERTVGGVPALVLPYRSGGTGRYAEAVLFVKDGLLYQVQTGSPSACDVAALNLRELDAYSRMLETFKFGK